MLFVALLVLNCPIKYLDLVRVRKSLPKACKESLRVRPVHAPIVLRIHEKAVPALARADLHPAAAARGRELRLAFPAKPVQAISSSKIYRRSYKKQTLTIALLQGWCTHTQLALFGRHVENPRCLSKLLDKLTNF